MPRTPEQLTEQAWQVLDKLAEAGRATLPSGKVIIPEDKTLVDIFKWLATLQGKPHKTPRAMDDWAPKETKGDKA